VLKTYVFYCSNHPEASRLADHRCGEEGDTVKTVGLPCSGKVDVPYLLKAFETGADGVVVLTCDQSQCLHLEGTARARKRVEAVDSLVAEIGAGRGRIMLLEWEQDGIEATCGRIQGFLERLRSLPRTLDRAGAVQS
jgi:coenzyme F420-reducing hydrogenase delta subunit